MSKTLQESESPNETRVPRVARAPWHAAKNGRAAAKSVSFHGHRYRQASAVLPRVRTSIASVLLRVKRFMPSAKKPPAKGHYMLKRKKDANNPMAVGLGISVSIESITANPGRNP